MKILVLFYSMYGHVYRLAEAVAEGIKQAGAEPVLRRVPELVPEHILEKSGAKAAQQAFEHVPIATIEELPEYDAIIFGTPARFGNMCSQMRNFLDQTGGLWAKKTFVGKVGSVFTSTNTQHGGQESTILSFHTTLLHLGMVIVGLPYIFEGQARIDEITGGSPYGASTIVGNDGSRTASENELAGARFQGEWVTGIASKLKD
ncbi:MAG: NAD(P)H:quinone oxidoreductase [Candidatus Heimdallarchaeota archaeon]|nr:NAD(P)H:quinone oxidoreductase [Candidatus Heimdallarchaeota archaeon]MCK4877316.1 NAD(P)H:quinone oxidoreductase [Candidatus Heimdallarchaeota archaeon]